jgi:hypothetical protein
MSLQAALNAIGWIVLIGALWLLCARTLGWDNANVLEAAVFGLVIYFGFRSAPR